MWLQGFAVRIEHADLTGGGLFEAVTRVLDSPQYAAAAKGVSVKLRARKRTSVQEAVGAVTPLFSADFCLTITTTRDLASNWSYIIRLDRQCNYPPVFRLLRPRSKQRISAAVLYCRGCAVVHC